MGEDFKSQYLRTFQEIKIQKEKQSKLGVEVLTRVKVLSRSNMEKEEVERLRKEAVLAISCGGEMVDHHVKTPRRCKWGNRGYCNPVQMKSGTKLRNNLMRWEWTLKSP